ncbi:MAG: radical SAM family heme chaperone HemW [Oscillospiraceae bacterium]|nr:radical SAM family heme chaperone HemW [Oscillospiraceae bacterium]
MSAGIYIHVPFCAVKCPYCDFYSQRYSNERMKAYALAVCRNIAALPEQLPVNSVYFGGGTPSLLPLPVLESFLDAIQKHCHLAEDTEITLEANPLTMREDRLKGWRTAGINRLSVGIQSFQQDVLLQLGRKHTPEQGIKAVHTAHEKGFENISIDLMFGLAKQNPGVFQSDLEQAVQLPVGHISSYMLKIEENTPYFHSHPPLADEDETADCYLQMHAFLQDHGYGHYEISNFAKSGLESRHNCKYWRLEPYYGIGPGAHSCHSRKRYSVPKNLEAFCKRSLQEEIITEEKAETETERIMLGLRMAEGILLSEIPQSREYVLRQAKPLIPHFLQLEKDRLRMTENGWLVSNAVLTRLMNSSMV